MPKIGIVGLSQVGKTTLFRILTHRHGSGLASGKQTTHVAVVHVPEARLDRLVGMHPGRQAVHATVEYVDTPGSIIELARSGQSGATLREMDALAQVVRVFRDPTVPHPAGTVDPLGDIENVELELVLSDLATAERRLARVEGDLKKQKSPALEKEAQVLQLCKTALDKQTPLREVTLAPDEELVVRGFTFLSLKPMLYVLNLGEEDTARANAAEELGSELGLRPRARTAVTAICGKLEDELTELGDAEAVEFMASFGLQESAAARLIRSSYHLLDLISFFTIGEHECRAWTLHAGATAFAAAGEVHTDFQRKFIRAEVIRFEDLVAAGNLAEARHRALLRLEGKEYVIRDGDVVYFRHSG